MHPHSTPRCLILDTDADHAKVLAGIAADCGFEAQVCARPAAEPSATETGDFDLVFLELDHDRAGEVVCEENAALLEHCEVFVMSRIDEPGAADEAIRRGASYYFCKPAQADHLRPLLEDIAAEFAGSDTSPAAADELVIDQFGLLRGSSRSMRKLYRQIRKVAQSDVSVMIAGESGTGKELVAQTLHMMSARRDGPFVAFNCAAVPENLAESELFGHEKGAFSGAIRRYRGYFERAHGGTLLLDEITEMNIELQAKLLRVLETRALRRLGSEEDLAVDVRILSASNRAPDDAVRQGVLREDLYYRLAQFPLRVPALARRGTDVVGLAQYFLRELNETHGTALAFSEAALECIRSYHWPGNVREMKHMVERAYIMSESVIDSELQQAIESQHAIQPTDEDIVAVPVGSTIADMERQLILATLEHTSDDKQTAANLLGISLKTLYNRLRDYTDRR